VRRLLLHLFAPRRSSDLRTLSQHTTGLSYNMDSRLRRRNGAAVQRPPPAGLRCADEQFHLSTTVADYTSGPRARKMGIAPRTPWEPTSSSPERKSIIDRNHPQCPCRSPARQALPVVAARP